MNISKKVHLLKPHISVLHVTHMVHFACRQVKNPQLWGDNVERGLKLEYDIWVVVTKYTKMQTFVQNVLGMYLNRIVSSAKSHWTHAVSS